MRVTILGGGGFRVPLMVRALLGRRELGVAEIRLYDTDPARLAVIEAVLTGDGTASVTIRAVTDLDDALRGADVVFSAIRVGGAAERAADERLCLSLGILGQETVGAAGLLYGLRTVPVALDIAERIGRLAPTAWTINFTNPAGMITQALRSVLGPRVIGICDSPVGLIRRACAALGVPADLRCCDYAGINHLGWLRSVTVAGSDRLPALLADDAALARFEEGRLFGGPVLRAVGALPNEYLRFFYDHRTLTAELAQAPSRGEVLAAEQGDFYAAASADPVAAPRLWEQTRLDRERSYLAETRAADEQRDAADLSGGGYQEVAVDLIAALSGGPAATLIVNVPNQGTIPQLPPAMVVEVPCTVDANGATPLPVAPLTEHQLGLVAAVRAAEQAVIAAATTGSAEQRLRAFLIHPLVGSIPAAQALAAHAAAEAAAAG